MKEWGRLGVKRLVFEILSQLGKSQIEEEEKKEKSENFKPKKMFVCYSF